jgi:hypothetical protein
VKCNLTLLVALNVLTIHCFKCEISSLLQAALGMCCSRLVVIRYLHFRSLQYRDMADGAEPAPKLLFGKPIRPFNCVLSKRKRKQRIRRLDGRWRCFKLFIKDLRPFAMTETRILVTLRPYDLLHLTFPFGAWFFVKPSIICGQLVPFKWPRQWIEQSSRFQISPSTPPGSNVRCISHRVSMFANLWMISRI